MTARFRVDDAFALESRLLFVLAGEIVEGTVRAGMVLHVPLNSSLTVTALVHGVESLRAAGTAGSTALTIRADDDLDLALWEGMRLGDGEILSLTAPEHPPADKERPPPRKKPWWMPW